MITARESISYNALKTININTVKVADPAFTLPKKLLSLPDNWLERNMVGINASPLILQNGKIQILFIWHIECLFKKFLIIQIVELH